MADFCKQCSIYHFGKDSRDLALVPKGDELVTICEGCGPSHFDHDGVCLGKGPYEPCLRGHLQEGWKNKHATR